MAKARRKSRGLTFEERLRAAVGYASGIPQHELAMLYNTNSGRIGESVPTIILVAKHPLVAKRVLASSKAFQREIKNGLKKEARQV